MFSKDEILAIPSVSLSSSAGLIPIWRVTGMQNSS
jgi:hypothetical protein